jgi:subtilisin family serine protease
MQSSASFLSTLNTHGVPASLNHDLSFDLFHGGSFTLLDGKSEADIVKKISSWPVVKKVSPVRELQHSQRDVLSVAHGAPARRTPVSHGVRRCDTAGHESNDYPHVMTGVDKLRQQGYLGTGIRVAVVDSGVDYKHPALGGCFGKGCLVEFGFNFLDNTTDPWEGHSGHGMFTPRDAIHLDVLADSL